MARPQKVSEEDILKAVEQDERAFLSTPEITELVDASKDTIRRRLNELAEGDRIEHRKLKKTTIWWLPSTVAGSTDSTDADTNADAADE